MEKTVDESKEIEQRLNLQVARILRKTQQLEKKQKSKADLKNISQNYQGSLV